MFFKSSALRVFMATLAAASVTATAAATQSFPSRPINVVVPYTPGGGTDLAARVISDALGQRLGQKVVVENRPGANGAIGTETVRRAPADGYTLLFTISSLIQNPLLYSSVKYDPFNDFTPVAEVARQPIVFGVNAKLGIETLDGFVERAKASPGGMTYGSFGTGGSAHLYTEVLQDGARIKLLHVPYQGATAAINDMLSGQIDATYLTPAGAKQYAEAKRVIPLAITGSSRLPLTPEIPTFAELGYAELGRASWFSYFGPSGMPKEIVDKLAGALIEVMRDPAVRERIEAIGAIPTGTDGVALTQDMRAEYDYWKKIIADKNIRVE